MHDVQESASYGKALSRLRNLKPAIEHLELLIQNEQKCKMAGFDTWHVAMQRSWNKAS